MIVVKPAGFPTPKIDKRAAESVVCIIDCSELLDPNEVIVAIDLPKNQSGITFSDIRSRKGTTVEIRVDNDDLVTSQYVDFIVNVFFTTNFKNKKLAVFGIRVYK